MRGIGGGHPRDRADIRQPVRRRSVGRIVQPRTSTRSPKRSMSQGAGDPGSSSRREKARARSLCARAAPAVPCRVENRVGDPILQHVDFVDIEDVPVCLLSSPLSRRTRCCSSASRCRYPDDILQAGVERQVDDAHPLLRQRLAVVGLLRTRLADTMPPASSIASGAVLNRLITRLGSRSTMSARRSSARAARVEQQDAADGRLMTAHEASFISSCPTIARKGNGSTSATPWLT